MKKQILRVNALTIVISAFVLMTGYGHHAVAAAPKLICSSAEAIACDKQQECIRGPVDLVNLPLFFEVDFGNKVVNSLTEAGEKRTSPITNVQSMDGYKIVQGTDVDTGWSMLINDRTGLMTLGITAPGEGFTIFGACVLYSEK